MTEKLPVTFYSKRLLGIFLGTATLYNNLIFEKTLGRGGPIVYSGARSRTNSHCPVKDTEGHQWANGNNSMDVNIELIYERPMSLKELSRAVILKEKSFGCERLPKTLIDYLLFQ